MTVDSLFVPIKFFVRKPSPFRKVRGIVVNVERVAISATRSSAYQKIRTIELFHSSRRAMMIFEVADEEISSVGGRGESGCAAADAQYRRYPSLPRQRSYWPAD